jgi:mannose/fructose/N-acetylgalactosamine-specific phosphotransferase system component IIB
MGAARSYTKVIQELHKSKTIIARWGRDWNWAERTLAWDNDIAQKAKEAAQKTASEMVYRHLKIAGQLQAKAVAALEQLPASEMNARDIAAIMKLGVDIERLIYGEPTERTENKTTLAGEVNIHQIDLSSLTNDELERLDEITSKLSPA